MSVLISVLRVTAGVILMALATAIFAVVCTVLLPSRRLRIRACNLFGHVVGRAVLFLAGARIDDEAKVKARMNASFPAIYVSNHTSALDIFAGMWASPFGTCGIAKKEVVYYPFLGQLYLISGHLLIDRTNHERAIEAMRQVAAIVLHWDMSVWLWPEGTRSKDGRLRPFKKGFAHLALATGLPVVPVVVSGAHHSWKKGSLVVHPTRLGIQVLDPIPTTDWTLDTLDAHVAEVHARFAAALPEDQRPLVELTAAAK